MARDRFVSDDPRAPYKVIQGEKIAASITRAEARRRQQQIQMEQYGDACWIQDVDGNVAS